MRKKRTSIPRRNFLYRLGFGSITLAAFMSESAHAVHPLKTNDISRIKGNLGKMIDKVCASDFKELLGNKFHLFLDDNTSIEVELIELESFKKDSKRPGNLSQREPFSLVFRAPSDSVLQQKMYRMKQAELGTFELFLVPIGPFKDEIRLEAVFN